MLKNLIFLGPPGAGKGTIASQLAKRTGLVHISTGDIFRSNIKNKTPLGLQVEEILARGDYVPDDITNALIENRLNENDVISHGYILDGYPRTLVQAEALQQCSNVQAVINFEILHEEVIKRLAGRLICKQCGASYHRESMPPKKDLTCDHCQAVLITRPDDQPEAIRHRLEVYDEKTATLISFYKNLRLLHSVDATPPSETVLQHVLKLM